jgi:hypothetical protein
MWLRKLWVEVTLSLTHEDNEIVDVILPSPIGRGLPASWLAGEGNTENFFLNGLKYSSQVRK